MRIISSQNMSTRREDTSRITNMILRSNSLPTSTAMPSWSALAYDGMHSGATPKPSLTDRSIIFLFLPRHRVTIASRRFPLDPDLLPFYPSVYSTYLVFAFVFSSIGFGGPHAVARLSMLPRRRLAVKEILRRENHQAQETQVAYHTTGDPIV
jgi:hypothetical protein